MASLELWFFIRFTIEIYHESGNTEEFALPIHPVAVSYLELDVRRAFLESTQLLYSFLAFPRRLQIFYSSMKTTPIYCRYSFPPVYQPYTSLQLTERCAKWIVWHVCAKKLERFDWASPKSFWPPRPSLSASYIWCPPLSRPWSQDSVIREMLSSSPRHTP